MQYYYNNYPIHFTWLLIEQDNTYLFNIGKLLNIGFLLSRLDNFIYFFHPLDGRFGEIKYLDNFDIIGYTELNGFYPKTFLYNSNTYRKLNGINILYEGWGTEDDDLFVKCSLTNTKLDKVECGSYDPNDNKNRVRLANHKEIIERTIKEKNIFHNGLDITGFKVNSISKLSYLTHYKVTW